MTSGPDGDGLLALVAGEATLTVALLGATPLAWTLPLLGERTDVLDGYRDTEELRRQDGVRNGVMAPFCNRVADGRYTFDGRTHDLLPGSADRTIYHGLVRAEPFTLVDLHQEDREARALLRCDALADGTAPGYPFEVVVEVSFRLTPDTLEMAVTGRNVGDGAAPFAAGWHPYFRLPGRSGVDGLHLVVPATVAIRTDDDLLPLPGADAYDPDDDAHWAPLAGHVLDAAYAGLRPDGSGLAETALVDPRTGVRLAVRQERGLVHVFTGDTLGRDRRASVAVEPVEVMTDAFNRPDCADAVRLEPGTARTFRFSTTVTTGHPPPRP